MNEKITNHQDIVRIAETNGFPVRGLAVPPTKCILLLHTERGTIEAAKCTSLSIESAAMRLLSAYLHLTVTSVALHGGEYLSDCLIETGAPVDGARVVYLHTVPAVKGKRTRSERVTGVHNTQFELVKQGQDDECQYTLNRNRELLMAWISERVRTKTKEIELMKGIMEQQVATLKLLHDR